MARMTLAGIKGRTMTENKTPMQQAADSFVRDLDDRTSPLLDFYPGGELAAPVNAVTGRGYSGLNRVLLSGGGADPRWFTGKQAQEAGYQPDENAQGRQAVYWEFKETRAVLDDRGRPVLDEDGQAVTETVERDRPALRFYTLYHASELRRDNGQPLPAYQQAPAKSFSLDRLENIIQGSGLKIEHDQRNLSFYRARDDSVHLMPPEAYPDHQTYAAELLKTLARASRHQDRLNRPCGPLGSEAYAKEELRIVLSSMMMAQDLGLPFVRDNNESYAKVWGEILNKDPYELARACRDAEQIKEYVMSLGQNLERGRPQPGPEQQTARETGKAVEPDRTLEVLNDMQLAIEEPSIVKLMRIVEGMDENHPDLAADTYFSAVLHDIKEIGGEIAASGHDEDHPELSENWQAIGRMIDDFEKRHLQQLDRQDQPKETGREMPDPLYTITAFRRTGTADGDQPRPWMEAEDDSKALFFGVQSNKDGSIAATYPVDELRYAEEKMSALNRASALNYAPPAPLTSTEKVYLNVHYMHKAIAKELGATWDNGKKSWCARPGVDLELLGRWIPKQTREALLDTPKNDPVEKLNLTSERGVIDGLALAAKEQSLDMILHIDKNLKQSISEARSFTSEEAAILNKSPMLWESGQSVDEAARQEVYANQKARENEFWQNHSYLRPAAPLTALIAEARLTVIASKRTTSEEAAILNNSPWPWEGGRSDDEAARQEVYATQKARENEAWRDVAKKVEEYEHQHLQPENKAIQEPAPEKTFLAVPYREKEAAKKLGAKWDRDAGLWYAPEGVDLAPLAKFIPEKTPAPAKEISPEAEFAQALEKAGLKIDGMPIIDGKIHRVPVIDGRPGNRDGAYCAYADGRPAGWMMNYRTGGEKVNWVASGQTLTVEQKATLLLQAEERKAEREAQRQVDQKEAIEKVVGKWRYEAKSGWGEIDSHPYLTKKGVVAYGLKEDLKGNLMVPGYDQDGKLKTIQTINVKGDKYFEPGCPKAGAMHIIGEDEEKGAPEKIRDIKAPKIYISEGYATGATVHLATNSPVVMAFDANNLKAVAMAVREIHPEANIILCADNDHKNDKNVGLEKAQEAAQAVGGEVISPEFTKEEMARGLTDFNDLHQARGIGAVRDAFQKQQLGRAAAQVKAAVAPKVGAGMGL